MYGDFSRLTFAPEKRYSSVLIQQGRVSLDADTNENTAILLHLMRTLARDLVGPYGGPQDAGFGIGTTPSEADPTKLEDLLIGYGHYYVEGLLVENPRSTGAATGISYYGQPDAYL